MLGEPLIWWGGLALALLLVIGGGVLIGRGAWARRGRAAGGGGKVGRRLLAGGASVAIGLGVVVGVHVYGPWWRHAPTWVLIRVFPTYAPEEPMGGDVVAAELRQRVEDWAVGRRDRERLAAVCGAVIRDPAYPWQLGRKAVEIMVWMQEEKYAHTDDLIAGLERAELRGVLLEEMRETSDMGAGVRGAMMRIVADESMSVKDRCGAAWVLTVMGARAVEAVGVLTKALEGPDAEAGESSLVRVAARALGRMGPAAGEDVAARLEAVSGEGWRPLATRYTARVAAMCVRGEAANEAEAHAAFLRDADAAVRRRAALGLRWGIDIRESGVAVEELKAAMGDEDEEVALIARETLERLVEVDERYGEVVGGGNGK